MAILLDHLIVPAHNPVSSAQCVADILGVQWEAERGHCTPMGAATSKTRIPSSAPGGWSGLNRLVAIPAGVCRRRHYGGR